ncbi:hypothetical protein GALMADRAFT_243084 [Galerina marginata CBS 339.88]|uniref:Major facilitator superfamily (MFS) profile domain-containing protein n=1 Tax=Galerina marginata (strain CBS 339.88) TaxID=685588 RepID=A0A067T7R4_GALM3|nr:hypothetical protein GALMADRAFT_243084 [Galerina marginata CBS 339.88]
MFTTFPVKPRPSNDYDSYRPQSPRIYSARPSSPRITPNPPRPNSPSINSPRAISPRPVSPRPNSPSVTSHSPLSPKLKREHRVAKVYQLKSPTFPSRPEAAHTQERPAPILQLPGLPPFDLPRSVLTPKKKSFTEELAEKVENGRSWLAQLRPPWVKESRISVIPPVTPKTAKYFEEAGHSPKSAKFPSYGQTDEEQLRDPPPLYKKHAPEGGLYGWMSVAGAFFIQFCTIGFLFTWNVFEEHYNHVFLTDQNPIAVRFIGSVQFFLAFLLSLVAGKLADSGFFRHTVHGGSVLFAACLLLLSFVGEEEFGKVFALQALGMGIGIGLVFVPTALVPLHFFKRKRGMAIGIVMSGGSLGGVVFPSVLRLLIKKSGLGGGVRIVACVILGFLLIGNGLLRTPPKEEKSFYPQPRLDLAKYSKEMGYVFAAGGTFLTMLFIYWPVMYLDLIGVERGVNPNTAFYMVIVLSLSGILGRVGLGFASDIVGPWNLLLPVSGFLALMMLTMCSIQGPKSLGVFAFFYGIFSGAWLSLMVTALSSLASRISEAGTRVGLVLSISSLGILFSALLQHGVLTPQHMWVIPSILSGLIFIGVTALAFLSRKMILVKKAAGTRRRLQVLKEIPILKGIVIL